MSKRANPSLKLSQQSAKRHAAADKTAPPSDAFASMIMELETRIAFDAAAVATLDETLRPGDAPIPIGAPPEAADIGDHVALADALARPVAGDVGLTAPQIVFIDAGVPDRGKLLAGIKGAYEIVELDPNRDGVEQIADTLAQRGGVGALHILAHGRAGSLALGTAVLDFASMTGKYADQLASLKDRLTTDADILIYGCDFADGTAGVRAVQALAALTGADVAASDDLTGAAELGGDWDLEVNSGAIETMGLAARAWEQVLADRPPTIGRDASGINHLSNPGFETVANWTQNSGAGTVEYIDPDNPTFGAGELSPRSPNGGFAVEVEGSVVNHPATEPLYIENSFTSKPETVYELTFFALTRAFQAAGFFNINDKGIVYADGVKILEFGVNDHRVWQFMTVHFAAKDTSTTIRIASAGSDGGFKSQPGDGSGLLIDGVQVREVADAGSTTTYTEGSIGVLAFNSGMTIYDIDDTNIQSATVRITNAQAGDVLYFNGETPSGMRVFYDPATKTLTFSGSATRATYQSVLGSINFANNSDNVRSSVERIVQMTVSDGDDTSNIVTSRITTVESNDAPVVDLNSSRTSKELITNGTFAGGATPTGWGRSGSVANESGTVFFRPLNTTGDDRGTLTQAAPGAGGAWNVGPTLSGTAQLTFTLGWGNNSNTDENQSRVTVKIGTKILAVVTTGAPRDGTTLRDTAAITYIGGTTGNMSTVIASGSSVAGTKLARIVLDLPPGIGNDELRFEFDASGTGTDHISIANVSGTGLVDLTSGVNYTTSYVESGPKVAIGAPTTQVRDQDHARLQSATITLTNAQSGDVLEFGTLAAGVTGVVDTATAGRITVRLTGAASQADYAAMIRGTLFHNSREVISTTARTIDVTVNDGTVSSATARTTINVTDANDAPVNTLPTEWTTTEDTDVKLTGLQIADLDSGTSNITIRLSVPDGTGALLANGAGSVSVAGNNSTSLTLTGTVANLNAYLAGTNAPTFRPAANTNGAVPLTVLSSDGGNTGAGGTLTDEDIATITITPVNDSPVNTVPGAQTLNEDEVSRSIGGLGVADVDGDELTVTLSVLKGTLTAATTGGAAITGAGTGTLIVTGTPTQINAAIGNNNLKYTPTRDYFGADTLTMVTNDGEATDTDTVALTVNAGGDIANDTFTTPEDTPVTITPLGNDSFENTDRLITAVNGTAVTDGGTVTLTNGTLVFTAATNSFVFTPNANFSGAVDFNYTVTSGGVTEKADIRINVSSVEDAPIIRLNGPEHKAIYDQTEMNIGESVTVTDGDPNQNLTSLTIKLEGPRVAEDTLKIAGTLPAGLTAAFDAATGILTITGNRPPADYAAALAQVQFKSTSTDKTERTISVVAQSNSNPRFSNTETLKIAMLDTDSDGLANAGDIDDDNDGVLDINETKLVSLGAVVNGNFADGHTGFYSEIETVSGQVGPGYEYADRNGIVGHDLTYYHNNANERIPGHPWIRPGTPNLIFTTELAQGLNKDWVVLWRQTIPTPRLAEVFFTYDMIYVGTKLDILVDGSSITNGPQSFSLANGALPTWRPMSHIFYSGQRDMVTVEIRQFSTTTSDQFGITNLDLKRSDAHRDGYENRLDLDSDNDGITDNIEAQATGLYIAPSGTSAAMTDADKDGLDDKYDANTSDRSVAASIGLVPVNTDGADDADILDADSDNDGLDDITERGVGPTSITSTVDTDKDGLLDIFEGASTTDGFVVADEILVGAAFSLTDADNDTDADGKNAAPRTIDLDFRDNLSAVPTIDLDGNDSSGATGNDYNALFLDAPVAIADVDAALADLDHPKLAGATITLTNPQTGDRLLVDGSAAASGTLASGIAWTRTDSEVRLSGVFTQAEYQAALQMIAFTNVAAVPALVTRVITVQVSDSVNESTAATTKITIQVRNMAPVNSVKNFTTKEDTGVTLSGLSLADADAGAGAVKVTLSVASGTLSASAIPGITVTGTGTGSVVLSGTLSALNAYLAGADAPRFVPPTDFVGTIAATMLTSDEGNTGLGGAKTDSDTFTILVGDDVLTPEGVPQGNNDAPVNTVKNFTTKEDTGVTLSGLSLADADAGAGAVKVTLSVASGTLSASAIPGITVTGTGTGSVVLSGTLSALNAYLAGADAPRFVPPTDFVGTVAATMLTSDEGNTGLGGAKTDSDTFTILVGDDVLTPEGVPQGNNDAPVNTVKNFTTKEDTGVTLSGLSLADADAGAGAVKVTLSVASGTLSASAIPGITVTGTGTGSVVLSGTLSALNAYLAGADAPRFVPPTDFVGTVAATMLTSDEGNTGLGGAKTDSDTFTILVGDDALTPEGVPQGNNDAPVNTVKNFTTKEDTGVTLSGLSLADADAGAGAVKVTLSVASGTLSASAIPGITVTGTGTGSVVLSGTLSALNAYLAGADAPRFVPPTDFVGTIAATMLTSDEGNTGLGGAKTDSDTFTILVGDDVLTPEGVPQGNNDAPVNTVKNFTTKEDTGVTLSGLSLADADAGAGAVKVTLSVASGTLSASAIPGITVTGTGTGSVVLSGTLSALNAYLAGADAPRFVPPTDFVGTVAATMLTSDEGNTGLGGAKTDSDTFTILVGDDVLTPEGVPQGNNDAPVNTVKNFTTKEDTGVTLSGLSLADADAGAGAVKVTLSVASGTLSASAIPGITVTGTGTGSVVLSGTLSALNAYLAGADAPRFVPPTDFVGTIAATMLTSDEGNTGLGGAKTDSDTFTILVGDDVLTPEGVPQGNNDAPVNTVKNFTTKEDTGVTLSGLSLADADAGAGAVKVTLSVASGTLSASAIPGITVTGTGTGSVVLSGTLSALNAYLAGADAPRFVPPTDFVGTVAATMLTSDEGNTGLGGAKTDSDTFTILVGDDVLTPEGVPQGNNDAPVNTVKNFTTKEDTGVTLSGLSLADADAGAGAVKVTLSVASGTLSASAIPGITVTGTGTGSVVLSGTLSALNAYLAGADAPRFIPPTDFVGTIAATMLTSDEGNTGLGGAKTDSDTFSILVSLSDEPPAGPPPAGPPPAGPPPAGPPPAGPPPVRPLDGPSPGVPSAPPPSTPTTGPLQGAIGDMIDGGRGDGSASSGAQTTVGDGMVTQAVNEADALGGTPQLVVDGMIGEVVRETGTFGEASTDIGAMVPADIGLANESWFAVEVFRRHDLIYVLIAESAIERPVEDLRVTLADGRALPNWLTLTSQGVLVGTPPAGMPMVDLRVQGIANGEIFADTLRLDLMQGAVLDHVGRPPVVVGEHSFSSALAKQAPHRATETLLAALTAYPPGDGATPE